MGKDQDNKGFTLVEMIIVLVIIALLAAILIPVLLGYIDEAKSKQNMINAKAVLNAVQSELTKLYAKTGDPEAGKPVISGGNGGTSGNEDRNIVGTPFADKVLELADLKDNPPFCLMVGVGSNAKDLQDKNADKTGISVTDHDKYTVYYIFYLESLESEPLYYYNGEWTKDNPRLMDKSDIFSKNNVIQVGALKGKRIQYYMISNETKYKITEAKFWDWIKGKREY